MTSTSPVPSRAALNALRGVLFTTSCSVVLLAEERRRRLNIARAAIENARKLHTVRSNRGPVALNESLEGTIPDLGQEVALGPPKKAHRRRRRDELINYLLHDPDFEIHKHYSGCDVVPWSQEEQKPVISINSGSVQSQPPRPLPRPLHPPQFLAPATFPRSSGPKVEVEQAELSEERQETVPHVSRLSSPTVQKQHELQLPYQDTLDVLKLSLEELQKKEADSSTTLQHLNVAVAALRRLVPFKASTPKVAAILESAGLKILKRAAELDPAKVPVVLSALMPGRKDCVRTLCPYIHWMSKRDDVQGFEQLLAYFSDSRESRFWMGGGLIYRLLHQFERLGGYESMKTIYQRFSNAGLYDLMRDLPKTEYKLRRFMFTKAFEAGDDSLVQKETEMIRQFDPDGLKADFNIQRRLITREASLGHWDEVRSSLDALIQHPEMKLGKISELLGEVAGIFAQSHTAGELEKLLRGLMSRYRITLKLQWVDSILNEYGSRRDIDSTISWLRFCIEHGFKLRAGFMEAFFLKCRKYWSLSEKSIEELRQTLAELQISITKEAPIKRAQMKARDEKSSRFQDESAEWTSLLGALEYMESLAARGEWEGVCEAYTKLMPSKLGFSSSCLRLAVLGWIKRGEGGIEQAFSLIREARGQGHDVTRALTPLLMARLERGDDGHALIRDALRHGVRLNDSIYNKAAQTTMAKGDMQGAITLCKLAARENGNRDLLYSDYNFSNLLFAYTGTASYGALRGILSRFTSDVLWWKGSPRCKESIKLAMKTTATRAVVNPEERKRHEQALFQLDEAFLHVKKCRATRRDRWAFREAMVRVVRRGEPKMETRRVPGREETQKEVSPSPVGLQAASEC